MIWESGLSTTPSASDAKNKAEPYQKVKFDRQIIAICRTNGVSEIYTDDEGLAKRARLCGIVPIAISEVPIPDKSLQRDMLDEQLHEPLPDPESDTE